MSRFGSWNPWPKKKTSQNEVKKGLEVLKLQEVKVSTVGVARIVDDEGRYLLIRDIKDSEEEGETILSPVGGKLKINEAGRNKLSESFGGDAVKFKNEDDLKFKMEGEHGNKYLKWYLERNQNERETDPVREIIEELTEESNILEKGDLENINLNFMGYKADLRQSTHTGKSVLQLGEVFDVKLGPKAMEKLKILANEKGSGVYFVSADDIKLGQAGDGTRIKRQTVLMLNPEKTIEDFV